MPETLEFGRWLSVPWSLKDAVGLLYSGVFIWGVWNVLKAHLIFC